MVVIDAELQEGEIGQLAQAIRDWRRQEVL
jgi:hypothetical protein